MSTDGAIILIVELVIIVVLLRGLFRGRCPNCGAFLGRRTIEKRTTKEAGFMADGKVAYTYQCNHCNHEWVEFKRIKAGIFRGF